MDSVEALDRVSPDGLYNYYILILIGKKIFANRDSFLREAHFPR